MIEEDELDNKELITILKNQLVILESNIKELTHQITHLERSNEELKAEILEDPDPDFKLALEENILVIHKKQQQILILRSDFEKIQTHLADLLYSSQAEFSTPSQIYSPASNIQRENISHNNTSSEIIDVEQLTNIINNTHIQQSRQEEEIKSKLEQEGGIFL